MLQGDDFSVFEGMVIKHRSTDQNLLQRVDCGVVEKASDWLVFRLGLRPKEVWTGLATRWCNKAKDVCGKSSAPLQSV